MLLRPAREEQPSKTKIVTIVASSHFKRWFLEAQVRIVTEMSRPTWLNLCEVFSVYRQ